MTELANRYHKFYNSCRVKDAEPAVCQARLALCTATKTVIRNALTMMEITVPEHVNKFLERPAAPWHCRPFSAITLFLYRPGDILAIKTGIHLQQKGRDGCLFFQYTIAGVHVYRLPPARHDLAGNTSRQQNKTPSLQRQCSASDFGYIAVMSNLDNGIALPVRIAETEKEFPARFGGPMHRWVRQPTKQPDG